MVRSRVVRGGYALDVHVERVIGMTIEYSTGTIVEQLVLGVVFGALGYMFSERYRRHGGRDPLEIPGSGLGVAAFLVLGDLLGPVPDRLFHDTAADRAHGLDGKGRPGVGPGPGDPGRPTGGLAPSWGGLGRSTPLAGLGRARPWTMGRGRGWTPGCAASGRVGRSPPAWDGLSCLSGTRWSRYRSGFGAHATAASSHPAGLARRSGGRHELRYWDGTKFTEHVADGGKITVDPL